MSELLKEHIEDMIANSKALLNELDKAKEIADLAEANALLREMRRMYIFDVDANGVPKAELRDIINLTDRVNKHLNN